MKDVSIILPSIRPQNLIKFYNAAQKACQRYTFEIILPSPYLPPEEILKKDNVRFIHTYTNPTLAFQLGSCLAVGKYAYNTTDDGLIQENAIDNAVDMFEKSLKSKDMINMVYIEDVLTADTLELKVKEVKPFPNFYWIAGAYREYSLPGIKPEWKLCPHFFMELNYFRYLGGFDCNYEYNNHALHDLAFRAQANGSEIYNLPQIAFLCSHLPERTGDHGPIHDAQTGPDTKRFNLIYSKPDGATSRIKLEYYDWVNHHNIWTRRFDTNNLRLNP